MAIKIKGIMASPWGYKLKVFFHLSTIQQRRHNNITELYVSKSDWLFDRDSIGNHFVNHFKTLFIASTIQYTDELHTLVQSEVTVE